ncbi:lipocalin family protein [Lewinella sp. 4G2]|uniref:lipocalin family protein n=1 Tax=Lewinella sp. 4G2 TaxID=1803372 RepID=UPI0007B49EA4|nr:lipocalin family protein [Lewinella sp. 4G2]OAV43751.1 hypothetical protein A3850_004230 [Lewinella sp. 4G2]
MKLSPLFLLLLASLCFTACEDDDDPRPATIIGTWKLVEVYADPGGGGDFEPVDSERIINFETDSTYSSNSIICDFSTETNMLTVLSEGTYDLDAETLTPGDCRNVPPQGPNLRLEFDGEEVILSYQCIEPCQHKYRRR